MGCFSSDTVDENRKEKNNIKENSVKENHTKDKESKDEQHLYKKNTKEGSNIILSEQEKENIVEDNGMKKNENYKIKANKGITILENIKEYLPQNIDRDTIKDMVYNALGNAVVQNDSDYIKGKNLKKVQVEGIIDVLYGMVSKNENVEENEIDDSRLNDVKVKIGFYDANQENIKRFFFKGKNPTEEEVENTLKQITSDDTDAKILAVELE